MIGNWLPSLILVIAKFGFSRKWANQMPTFGPIKSGNERFWKTILIGRRQMQLRMQKLVYRHHNWETMVISSWHFFYISIQNFQNTSMSAIFKPMSFDNFSYRWLLKTFLGDSYLRQFIFIMDTISVLNMTVVYRIAPIVLWKRIELCSRSTWAFTGRFRLAFA